MANLEDLEAVVGRMRRLGVVSLETPALKIILGPPPLPEAPAVKEEPLDPIDRAKQLREEAREQAREWAANHYPGNVCATLSERDLDDIARTRLGLLPEGGA